jgi:hypothetical protein
MITTDFLESGDTSLTKLNKFAHGLTLVRAKNSNHVPYLTYLSHIKSLCMTSAAKNKGIYETSQRQAESFWRIPIGDVEQMSTFDLCRATSSFFKGYRKFFHDCEAYEQLKNLG